MTAAQMRAAASPQKRGQGKVIKGHTKGAQKERAKTSKRCFVADCPETCKNKCKFCVHHFNVDACHLSQARKDPSNLAAYKEVQADPQKCRSAFDAWDAENPPGVSKKHLVEWGQWRKRYGVTVGVTQRQGEELMTIGDFIAMKKMKGHEKEEAEAEWQQMIDAGHEGEGDGKSRKLWIMENKKRFRDRTVYEDNGWDEGGKQKKGSNPDDREKMQAWALDSASFGTKFMVKAKDPASASSTGADAVAALPVNEADEINVALAAPALHKTLTKEVKVGKKAFTDSLTACDLALKAFTDLPTAATKSDDMIAYNDLTICRKFLGTYIDTDTPMAIQPPEGLQKTTLNASRTPLASIPSGSQSRGLPAARTPPAPWSSSAKDIAHSFCFPLFVCVFLR